MGLRKISSTSWARIPIVVSCTKYKNRKRCIKTLFFGNGSKVGAKRVLSRGAASFAAAVKGTKLRYGGMKGRCSTIATELQVCDVHSAFGTSLWLPNENIEMWRRSSDVKKCKVWVTKMENCFSWACQIRFRLIPRSVQREMLRGQWRKKGVEMVDILNTAGCFLLKELRVANSLWSWQFIMDTLLPNRLFYCNVVNTRYKAYAKSRVLFTSWKQ